MTNPDGQSGAINEAAEIARHIQATLISNTLTAAQWEAHIAECLQYHFHAAMIPGSWVRRTAAALRGTNIRTASFVDFPLGGMTSAGKSYEAAQLVQEGAQEIDLMTNVGFLLSGMEKEYFQDIHGVVEAAAPVPIKVMLELPLLNVHQKERAVQLSIEAGAAYLKNASGGAVGTATVEDIRFLRLLAPPKIRVKASGGIKSAQHVRDLLAAGADLVGTSSGVRIIRELKGESVAPQKQALSY